MNKQPLLTVMLPSRGRVDNLMSTIRSFYDNATSKNNIQFIVKIDWDDSKHTEYIHGLCNIGIPAWLILSERRRGYEDIHTFCNEMLMVATGTWIMLGNDDALMVSEGWDDALAKQESRCVLLNPSDAHGKHAHLFPIVNTEICKELGHFSLNAYTDRWLQNIYMPLDLAIDIPEIKIQHNNDLIDDQTRDDRINSVVYSDNEWKNTTEKRLEIIEFLKNKISTNANK